MIVHIGIGGKYMKRHWQGSIKFKLAMILMGILIPLVAYLIFYNFFMIRAMNEKITDSNRETLQLYCMNIEDDLSVIEKRMLNLVTGNVDFASLRYQVDDLKAYLSAYEVMQQYNGWFSEHSSIGALYLVSKDNHIYRAAYHQDGYGLETKEQIKQWITEVTDNGRYDPNWFTERFDEEEFLCRIFRAGGAYTICMIDLDNIKLQKSGNAYIENGQIVFYKDGMPMTQRDMVARERIALGKDRDERSYIAGEKNRYLVVESKLEKTDLIAALLIPYNGMLYTLNRTQILLFFLALSTALLIPLAYYLLHRTFIRPMSVLLETIHKISHGNMEAKIDEDYHNAEFNYVAESFNDMMDQIHMWKTSYYEKELAERQIHLQYLQRQIRPHFYLNCLKNLYGMVQEKKYKETQETILELSKYLRSMMQDQVSNIPLGKEMEHVRSFLAIYQLSSAYSIGDQENIAPEHRCCLIPPISILTFVENSIKYGIRDDRNLLISIRTKVLAFEEKQILNIVIADNGHGFSKDLMDRINSFCDYEPNEGHIGIYNVIQRLHYLYEDEAGLVVSGKDGAVIELFIPVCVRKEGEEHDADDIR